MKNYIKKFTLLLLFLIVFPIFNCIPSYSNVLTEVNLIENFKNNNTLPKNFRKSSDKIQSNENLNLSGLDKLNISGSAQFSESGLNLIKKSIGDTFPITIVDLRQESHGFINGNAVSWENSSNNSNVGLSTEEILKDENKRLKSIPLNKPITFHNNNNTIIPTKVQSEYELTKDNSLSYVRIPVTDGKLPTDDMVNYFVNMVKNQPKNSWLHFHCKQGIGRTTTFMIMYDIMKNCNNVSLNDIIARQIALSQIKEKHIKSFYTGERFNFLNKFYNNCKNNTYNTSSHQTSTITSDSYIKNSIIPKHLYVICEDDMTKEEQTMISTLQGIISTKSDQQIYILSKNEPDYKIWLNDLKENYNLKYSFIKNPWELLNKFKSYSNGYILYSNSNSYSINNACSLAALKDSIVINESLEEKVKSLGITSLIKDCRNTDKYWAYNTLWNSGLNHSTVIQLSPEKSMALRDYAIMSKSLIFYDYDLNDSSFRETIFKSMDKPAHCFGWGPDEHTNVSIASKSGVDVIAADWSYNLSVLSSYPSLSQTQKSNNTIPSEDGVHYVTFIMSDGDNQQWFLGSNYSSTKWYGSPYRGNFNLGWSISPSIYYLAPTVFNKYYESASSSKYSDNFIAPPSGNGYMYPSKFPINELDNYTKRLNDYMKKVDQNYVLIIDDDAFYKTNIWDKYTCHSNINGLYYLNYKKNNSYDGKILWSNNKPIVSCRDLLWGGLEDESQLINAINNRIKLGYTNVKSPNSYTFVYVHVWSNTMNNVQNVVNELNKNSKVRIVTPDIFMKLIKKNIEHC